MKELLGRSKVSVALPLLKSIAEREGLKLNHLKDFKKVREILEKEFIVKKIVW